jgi:tRNA(fMet)-specific endonuclease VapC
MRLLLDTNRYDDLNQGDPAVVQRIATASEVWLSVIVIGELRAGFLHGSQQDKNERYLAKFLSKPNVAVLLLSEETTEYFARVYVELKRIGTKIPVSDMWIAAQALEHDLELDTRDRHFQHVSGLKLV